MMNENNMLGVNDKPEKVTKKASKPKSFKSITSVKVSGVVARKLGCLSDDFQRQSFVMEVLKNVSREKYIDFMKDFVSTQDELNKFEQSLNNCEFSL